MVPLPLQTCWKKYLPQVILEFHDHILAHKGLEKGIEELLGERGENHQMRRDMVGRSVFLALLPNTGTGIPATSLAVLKTSHRRILGDRDDRLEPK